jgi:hypothetical protein
MKPMKQQRLPSFIVIGAAKAATTWIARQLSARDDVFLPGPEPHYFSREYARGADWYAGLFANAGAEQLVGEKSADYLSDRNVPARMAALLPAVKLIAQLRNPVDRAYSDYCMLFRRGQVNGDIDTCLDRARTPQPRFLDDGLYARHLARFLDHFPREQLKIVLHEEIDREPLRVIGEICATLGLDADVPVAVPERRVNDGSAAVMPRALRSLPPPVKKVVAPLRGKPVFESLRSMFARPVRYPPLGGDVRKRLEAFYADDVEQLGRFLGRDLSGWVAPAEQPR